MEPFALFNLLSSLLSQNPPPQNAENAPSSAPLPTEEPPTPSPLSTPKTDVPTPTQEALLNFLSTHDARVKRTKKP
ncbi:MAG: hypothetical protein E7368_03200 [Clostridiales bacterium]|nr:hypothetical protein [Clostridiales bacterium]